MTDKQTLELKNCPYCDTTWEESILAYWHKHNPDMPCPLHGIAFLKDASYIKNINNRPIEDKLQQRVDELTAALKEVYHYATAMSFDQVSIKMGTEIIRHTIETTLNKKELYDKTALAAREGK